MFSLNIIAYPPFEITLLPVPQRGQSPVAYARGQDAASGAPARKAGAAVARRRGRCFRAGGLSPAGTISERSNLSVKSQYKVWPPQSDLYFYKNIVHHPGGKKQAGVDHFFCMSAGKKPGMPCANPRISENFDHEAKIV
ncbi:MAG: hypothetical protein LBR44_00465 [Clostridiales Family XIII bacterium]|nr:hypothetical protein [Clostridiales Family XIII bacterium]